VKLYIAGSSKELSRAERWIATCRAAGIEITEDWVASMRAAGPDHAADPEVLVSAAQRDLDGVRSADLVWVLIPPAVAGSTGCWAELGAALAWGVPASLSAPTDEYGEAAAAQFCIFGTLVPERFRFASDTAALEWILREAGAA